MPLTTSDSKLQYALAMENEIRLTYPFANLYITFPTKPAPKFEGNEIYFPAYLKKITDTVTPNYTQTQVFGRTDPIATYKNTTRKLSVDFDIPAYTEFDANEILKRINILMKNMYPGYLDSNGQKVINSPPLLRIKFANIITHPKIVSKGLLGFADALAINHSYTENGMFVFSSEKDKEGYVFAKNYSLTLSFTALHEEVIGWDDSNGEASSKYPYNIIGEEQIPKLAKIGTADSNLRGSLTQDPATAKGLTAVFGV